MKGEAAFSPQRPRSTESEVEALAVTAAEDESSKETLPEDEVELREFYRNHLESKLAEFQRYAGPHAPPIRFAHEDESVPTAYFDHAANDGKGEVVLGLDFFVKNKLSPTQAEWVVKHELEHFKDFDRDPQSYTKMFEATQVRSRMLTDRLAQAYEEQHGEPLSDIRKASIRNQLPQMYFRAYYNSVEDIHVNHSVALDPDYAPGTHGDHEHEQLYKEVLSPSHLLSEQEMESMQYMWSMLRGENVRQGNRLTEAVQSELMRDHSVFGKPLSTKEIIDTRLNPTSKVYRSPSHAERHRVLDSTLRDSYERLLLTDMLRALEDYKGSPQEQFDTFMDGLIKQAESMFPDFIPEEVIKKWSEQKSENKEEADAQSDNESKIDPEQAKNEHAKKQAEKQKQWREQHGISEVTHEQIQKHEAAIQRYIDDLDELWRAITAGVAVERVRVPGGAAKSGTRINVPAIIRQYDLLATGRTDELRPFLKTERREAAVMKPERIEVSLILDRSGSMWGWGDGRKLSAKNRAIAEVSLLLMRSLERFNMYLDRVRDETKTKLFADSEVILYGTNAHVQKPFRGRTGSMAADRVEQYKVMESLSKNMGMNNEEAALGLVNKSIDLRKRSELEENKLMKIAVLITDGGTHPSPEIMQQIKELEAKGTKVYAIQIGDVNDREVELFKQTWVNDRPEPLGYLIGSDLSKLAPTLEMLLAEELSQVQI